GDGQGGFRETEQINLPGRVTAMIGGDVNRRDGLADLLIGVNQGSSSSLLVYEGSEGALKSQPEVFSLPGDATALAVGQFDDDPMIDFAAASGRKLTIVHGRDRKLSLDATRSKVSQARVDRSSFNFEIRGIAVGDFNSANKSSLALLGSDGRVVVTNAAVATNSRTKTSKKTKGDIQTVGQFPGAVALVRTKLSTCAGDDLLVLDARNRQVSVLCGPQRSKSAISTSSLKQAAQLDLQAEPVAVLSMNLNGDSINDLVIAQRGHIAPAIVKSAPVNTFVVNKADDHDDGTCDSDDCTLREAINAANLSVGFDAITFAIGTGAQTITPLT